MATVDNGDVDIIFKFSFLSKGTFVLIILGGFKIYKWDNEHHGTMKEMIFEKQSLFPRRET